jgi:hypothetical protein
MMVRPPPSRDGPHLFSRLARQVGPWLAALGLLVGLGTTTLWPDLSLRTAAGQVAAGATLSVLAAPVDVSVGGGAFASARDGITLAPGDQVRTGTDGVALITFFDGSEVQVTPESQVALQQQGSDASGPTSVFRKYSVRRSIVCSG